MTARVITAAMVEAAHAADVVEARQMRIDRASYAEIAEHFGWTVAQVKDAVMGACEQGKRAARQVPAVVHYIMADCRVCGARYRVRPDDRRLCAKCSARSSSVSRGVKSVSPVLNDPEHGAFQCGGLDQ